MGLTLRFSNLFNGSRRPQSLPQNFQFLHPLKTSLLDVRVSEVPYLSVRPRCRPFFHTLLRVGLTSFTSCKTSFCFLFSPLPTVRETNILPDRSSIETKIGSQIGSKFRILWILTRNRDCNWTIYWNPFSRGKKPRTTTVDMLPTKSCSCWSSHNGDITYRNLWRTKWFGTCSRERSSLRKTIDSTRYRRDSSLRRTGLQTVPLSHLTMILYREGK